MGKDKLKRAFAFTPQFVECVNGCIVSLKNKGKIQQSIKVVKYNGGVK